MKNSSRLPVLLATAALTLLATQVAAQVETGQTTRRSFKHDGYTRLYRLYVPAAYDGLEPWPLVLSFHGFGWQPGNHAVLDGMNAVADTAHFLVARPAGIPIYVGPLGVSYGWNVDGGFGDWDEYEFVNRIIDHVESEYAVDSKRIYVTGFSFGSMMSFGTACQLADRVASIASVAGPLQEVFFHECAADRPVATMLIHGTADPIHPYTGYVGDDFAPRPIPETPSFWARHNNCSLDSLVTQLPDVDGTDHSTVTLTEYTGCDADTEVQLYTVNNGGHTWPRSLAISLGAINWDIDATALIWDFFARHPHPNPSAERHAFGTQPQIDAFPDDRQEMEGYLWILNSSDITDLAPLSSLVSIEGDLIVSSNEALTGLEGLSSVTSVGGSLAISRNDALSDLNGLSGLTDVAEDLLVEDNASLAGLDGFPALVSIGEDLTIHQNSSLTRIGGFQLLNSVGGDVAISYNGGLTDVSGFSSLSSVGGHLQVNHNAALSGTHGFSALASVGGDLEITWNDSLTNLDAFSNVDSIGGKLLIVQNAVLASCSCGLYSCVASDCVEGTIAMSGNVESGDCNNNGADLVANACETVGIEDTPGEVPTEFTLHAAYPNPFNPTTTISYALPRLSEATLTAYDMLGRQVSVLASGTQPAGSYEVMFDATRLPSGVYFYRLQAGDHVITKRMMVVK